MFFSFKLRVFFIVAGILITTGIKSSDRNQSDDPSLQSLKMIAKVLDNIDRNPGVSLSSKDIVYAGIHGMFRTLDPYTQFLDEDAFDYMKAQQQGSFFGIGISFDVRNGELLVIAPIEESPAWKLGIRAGDVIEEIEGETVAGITSNEVIKRLRGEKGTSVRLGIRRKGVSELLNYEVIRSKITLNSARGGFLINQNTGYIRLTEFSSTTYTEMLDKMKFLQESGMEQLLLDLRFNGGGLLTAAEQVSSVFLQEGQTIVSTKGRTSDSHMEMKCKKDGPFIDLPLIILVNESSASASEIVAGAIQDHDRGLVVGTATHGKGLVGSQYQTRLETAAQITTAQYFTPSGRFIQRPFEIPHRKTNEADIPLLPDSSVNGLLTDMGRKVFERGGITPDIIVEEPAITPFMYRLELQRVFFDFAVNQPNIPDKIDETFEISDDLFQEFFSYLNSLHMDLDSALLDKEQARIRSALRREIFAVRINADAADKLRILELNAVQKAISLFSQMDAILTSGTLEADLSEESRSVVSTQ